MGRLLRVLQVLVLDFHRQLLFLPNSLHRNRVEFLVHNSVGRIVALSVHTARALAQLRALDSSVEALALLLPAEGLLAIAALLLPEHRVTLVYLRLRFLRLLRDHVAQNFNLRRKRVRIALQQRVDRVVFGLSVFVVVPAPHALAGGAAGLLAAEALAIQLQTLRLVAVAAALAGVGVAPLLLIRVVFLRSVSRAVGVQLFHRGLALVGVLRVVVVLVVAAVGKALFLGLKWVFLLHQGAVRHCAIISAAGYY